MGKINLLNYGKQMKEFWQPHDVAHVGNVALRVARIQGTYAWHVHKNEEEFFYVLSGEVFIDTENESACLHAGDGYLVNKGLKHRSKASEEAVILLIEPVQTVTKGEQYIF